MTARFGLESVINQRNITMDARPFGPLLLERIVETGSSRAAAHALGLDEDQAWQYLVAANNLADRPLLRPRADGLAPTRHARRLLGRAEELERAFHRFLENPAGGAFRQFEQRQRLMRRIEARTSARNQFYCQVVSVRRERVNAVVALDLGRGELLQAHITAHSAEALGLMAGRKCHALIDPAWVEVDTDGDCRQQQNCLHGHVVRCLADPVDTEVAIRLASGRIVIATLSHAERVEKNLSPGRAARVVIQSSQIILAVDAPAAE